MPLQINSALDEPYLQLPAPYENIRLTPPRLSDAPFSTAALNAPEVVPFLSGPPFPFHEENSISFINETKPPMDKVYQEIREKLLAGESDYIASGTPVSAIREVQPDGTELWIGDIGFIRSVYHEVEDETERERLVAENTSKKDGDSSIVWSYGSKSSNSEYPKTCLNTMSNRYPGSVSSSARNHGSSAS